jgi:hypothetical protein
MHRPVDVGLEALGWEFVDANGVINPSGKLIERLVDG